MVKKVGSTGKFGARYGVSIKKQVLKIDESMREAFNCPFCGFSKIKREAAGLFFCKKCGAKFTGGAYVPETLVGKTIRKVVSQRSFMTDAAELIRMKESSFADIEREVSMSLDSGDAPKEEKKEKRARKERGHKAKEATEADDEVEIVSDSEEAEAVSGGEKEVSPEADQENIV